jgi:murein DD-endopeptidase MepM/ murein hydrolase activator NlpD
MNVTSASGFQFPPSFARFSMSQNDATAPVESMAAGSTADLLPSWLARAQEEAPSAALAILTAALLANFGGLTPQPNGSIGCPGNMNKSGQDAEIAPTTTSGNSNAPTTSVPDGRPAKNSSRPADSATGAEEGKKVGSNALNADGYAFPVQGYQGEIGLHHGSNRGGSDIFAPRGTPVVAMRGGTVSSAGTDGVGGNNVLIQGDDGLIYYYAHMDQAPMVEPGAKVAAGQQLGVVGDSGNAKGTGPHLHMGIGPEIVRGVGPAGGTGGDFDAVGLLQNVNNLM